MEFLFLQDGNTEGRRSLNRVRMHSLATLNPTDRFLAALAATRNAIANLKPFEPLDLERIQTHLAKIGFVTGEPNGVIFEAVDTLTTACSIDRRRVAQILGEWEVKKP